MAYWDIAVMSLDQDLSARERACAAQEIPAGVDPWEWQAANALTLAASPGWSESWASAVAGNVPNPGRDPGVITDGNILSAVQALLAAP